MLCFGTLNAVETAVKDLLYPRTVTHVLRVAFVMKENISFDPGNVGLFSSDGMAFKANTLSDKI